MNRLQEFVSDSRAKAIPEVARGDGIYLWDVQGRRYLDGSSGAIVSNVGHNNARVKEAMRAQADRVTFAYAKVWDSAAHRELAQKLTAMSGLGFDSVFLVSGGPKPSRPRSRSPNRQRMPAGIARATRSSAGRRPTTAARSRSSV